MRTTEFRGRGLDGTQLPHEQGSDGYWARATQGAGGAGCGRGWEIRGLPRHIAYAARKAVGVRLLSGKMLMVLAKSSTVP